MARPPQKTLTLEIPALLLEGDQATGGHRGGPGSRYDLGLPSPGAETPDDLELPESYGTRRLWLVPRDPQWLYAHWDLELNQQREYNQLSRDGHLVLRIYAADQPAEWITEVQLHPESRSWFAHVGRGGGEYFAVLGFRDRTGEWNEISRSDLVGTPPDSLSEEVEAHFVTVPSEGSAAAAPGPLETGEEPGSPEASAPTRETPAPTATGSPPAQSLPTAAPPPETVVEVIEAVRDYLAGEPTLVSAIEAVCATGHPQLPGPMELPPPTEFVRWTPEQQQALARAISMEAVREVWAGTAPSSVAAAAAVPAAKELASAAAVPAGEAGAPAGLGAGAISSPPGGRRGKRAFWFDVNAELVIYGATEPDARVIIGDRPIRLRKDGTFSCRFALPDGWYGLPISATSADKVETRHASLRFMRETEYAGDVGAHPQDPALKPPGAEHFE